MTALKQYLASLQFSAADLEDIVACFKLSSFSKGNFFVKEESRAPYLGFIEEGVFQYFYNQDGNEITTYVVGQNGFIASLPCFLHDKPSMENIRAITNARVWMIHKDQFDKLKTAIRGFKDFYILILEQQLICIEESRFALLTLSAEERYAALLEKEPELLQQIPLQFLASTLGITPRHLSRIRNKIR